MNNNIDLPELEKDDYLTKNADFWKTYRKKLYMYINHKEEKLEKNPENITQMAEKIGIKPTARYFGISPASVRYNIKKHQELTNNN